MPVPIIAAATAAAAARLAAKKAAQQLLKKKATTGLIKAATKPGRSVDKNGQITTNRGRGMVSAANVGKGKNSKQKVTDIKSVKKALGSKTTKLQTKKEKATIKKDKTIAAWEKTYYNGKVPVKKK
jgi:hypothetical protein